MKVQHFGARIDSMSKEDILNKLADAVVRGKMADAAAGAQEALDAGVPALEAINEGLVKGMGIVGDNYGAHKMFLPQVLMAAHTMYKGLDVLLPAIPKADAAAMKKATIAVVEGDVHDIGKNIVKTMLTASGFDVLDLGKDIPAADICAKTEENAAAVVCLSTLMTPTMEQMRAVIEGLKESGYRGSTKVCIGGPPTTPAFAEEIGADHRDINAQDCVAWLKEQKVI